MQPMLPNPEMGRAAPRRVSRDLFLEQLERVRMDAAQAAAATVSFARPPLSTAAGIEKRCLTSPISSNARVRLPAPRPCGCGDGCPDCRTMPDYSPAHFRRIGRMGGLAGGRPRLRTFDEIAGEPRGKQLLREFQNEFRRWLSTESNS